MLQLQIVIAEVVTIMNIQINISYIKYDLMHSLNLQLFVHVMKQPFSKDWRIAIDP
jgi:hypothetical protein